jgi:hypothetical protein
MVACVREEALWRYDIEGRSEKSGFNADLRVIETPEGEPVGALMHSRRLSGQGIRVYMYELKAGVPFLAVTPGVMRYLERTGEEFAKRDGREFGAIAFVLGEEHPLYDTIAQRLPQITRPYAWYIRVPDLLAFVRHIVPALEKRLAASAQAGYTGELKVHFYRSGLHFRFQEGAISVEGWKPDRVEEGEAAFPDLTFLQMLFGFRSLEELHHAFPDCIIDTDNARALLPVLFPKKASRVWAGG